jgi:chemotaxis protein MotB
MALENRQVESDEAPGAPEWMVTFSDCMTLLLTFFVLLLSFSSFDDRIFRKLQMIFMEALPEVSKSEAKNKDSILPSEQVQQTVELLEGSEKPTLNRDLEDNIKKETPVDYRSRKMFSISSGKIFWGDGVLISPEGRRIMANMASFLKEVPSHVVISENGAVTEGSEHLGLSRAWAIIDYLTSEKKLDKSWFSVSAGTTMDQGDIGGERSYRTSIKSERKLEIVLLRSIYD